MLKFRKPTSHEAEILKNNAPDHSNFPNWATWTVSAPKNSVYSGEIKADNPLKFNLLLRRLFYSREPLKNISPKILDVLTEIYEPEANLLKAEMYKLQGDEQSFLKLKQQVQNTNPGLGWWIEMLNEHGAYLKNFRREVDDSDM